MLILQISHPLLEQLHKGLGVLQLENYILGEDRGQLDRLQAHVDLLQLLVADVVAFYGRVKDVHVAHA